jgi:hypothetical protein
MTPTIDQKAAETSPATDLATAALAVLAASSGPLTVSKIRAKLQAPFRSASLEELTDTLQRQVAASVLVQYPKYRSQQDRFWDRPMEAHLVNLFREALEEGPLGWTELRRKLPAYAVDPLTRAEAVLTELLAQRVLHRHPRTGKRGSDRFGLQPPDAKEYLRSELSAVFCDLQQLGFSEPQLRAAGLELLHDEEWSPTEAAETTSGQEVEGAQAASPAPVSAGQETLAHEGAQAN